MRRWSSPSFAGSPGFSHTRCAGKSSRTRSLRRRGDDVFYLDERIGPYRSRLYGLAVDIGTTTVVMNLVDLESGEVIHTASFENPQRFGGSDIMHRISYDGGEYRGELRQVMLSAINFEIGDMARSLGFHRRDIYEVVVVGNSTMRDIFFGLDVQPIGEKPYRSIIETEMREGVRKTTALHSTAREIGLRVFPGARVYGGPLIGSHVGADVAADILAVGIDKAEEVVMLVDVGTKHGGGGRQQGPADGGVVSGGSGVRGRPDHLRECRDTTERSSRSESRMARPGAPRSAVCRRRVYAGRGWSICWPRLRRNEIMNELGAFENGVGEFVFAPEQRMSLSRADISALAQAKSANYSGQYIVLRNYGMPIDEVSKLYLAGGFANYVDVDNALSVGFIANVQPERIVKVGNAALKGATIMLVSREMRSRIEELAAKVEHVELETTPDFFDIFVEGCMFKPMEL